MQTRDIIVERDVPCTLRDGIILYANIYRPNDQQSYPALLSRTPYNKNLPHFSHRYVDPIRLALHGYIVIIQDVRGRFASEGVFKPLIQEFEDGYDAVEWASALSYCNGKVGMFGMSYYAYTQLYAALEQPPSLHTITPAMTGHILDSGFFERNGVKEWAAIETWMLESVSPDYISRLSPNNTQQVENILADVDRIFSWYTYKTMKDWPPVSKHDILHHFFQEYFIQGINEKLTNVSIEKVKQKGIPKTPAYHIAGWYDSHLGHTLKNYEVMAEHSENQKLIIGPWAHGVFDSFIGERSFGTKASGEYINGKEDFTSLHLRWFDQQLKNKTDPLTKSEKNVKLFVMGINKWRDEEKWPLARTKYIPYYFSFNKSEEIKYTFSSEIADKTYDRSYLFHPENPCTTHGGGTLFYKGMNAGPRNQSAMLQRDDVIVFTSPVLDKPLEVTGWIKVVLWAKTDARDTEFTAKLIDVQPNGKAYNLTDGIVRASVYHANQQIKDRMLKYEIDLWATSNVFLSGHQIRVEISSSNFPRFEVNPNTGNDLINTSTLTTASQTIYFGKNYPSHILLPVIPSINKDQS